MIFQKSNKKQNIKIKSLNKILIIQWNDKAIRWDIGEQEINSKELITILKGCIDSINALYHDN